MRPREYLIPIYLWISASLLLHLLFAGGTRAIADRVGVDRPRLLAQPGTGAPGASEVEFDFPPEPPPPPAAAPPPAPELSQARPAARRPRPPPLSPVARATPPPPVAPTPLVPATPTPVVPPAVRPPPLQRFVDQTNPNEEPVPEDPQHLAQSNRNVAEETQAAVRNLERDQSNPRVGGAPNRTDRSNPGNADRQVSADHENTDGRADRVPDPRPRTAAAAATRPAPATPPAGERAPGSGAAPSTAGAVGREGAAGDPVPGGAGSVDVASGAQGVNGANGGGATSTSAGGYQGLRGLGARGALSALTPSWTSYAAVIGDARIEREAEEARRRRSAARGSFTDGWQDTRAAIENFVPHVRVGNQTALRTAASPFAAYLTAMHRRIHRLFADGFLEGLGRVPSNSPLQDEGLVTTVEIVLERSGAVHSLGVVRSSGVLPFDVAAVNAVRRSAPFGEAPSAILSGDGRVYVRWGFHRDHRQCGTFNAEPFILPAPGASPPRSAPPPGPSPTTDEGPPARLGMAPVAAGVPGSRG
jgi:TonB family protein